MDIPRDHCLLFISILEPSDYEWTPLADLRSLLSQPPSLPVDFVRLMLSCFFFSCGARELVFGVHIMFPTFLRSHNTLRLAVMGIARRL